MKSKRWQQIESLYQSALDLNPGDRDAFLIEKCRGDEELRREVESLLRQQPDDNPFHTAAAFKVAGQALVQETSQSVMGRDIGSYKVHSLIGVGGMGEVYRAKDLNLGRDVAIKILPASVANDPDRLSRLEREARLLAALNHPHIGAIYGFERSNGVSALVLEMVEGTTLAERLASGPLRLAEALKFALQIAQALEAAHEKGIIHRDLKPANIKITPDGTVKVLDFGLAKAFAGEGTAHDLSQLPTLTIEATGQGVIAGTPSYMSPEQARGNTVDKRTDVWAFGCVLYELITGRRAFARETVSDTIACILEREPDWSALPTATPDAIRRLLTRCLAKDPKRRLRDIADARLDIEEAQSEPRNAPVAAQGTRRKPLAWISVSVILALIASLAGMKVFLPTVPAAPEMRFEITTPTTPDPVSLAISPDGQQIVFVATSEGRRRLWLRSLDSVSARPLVGTDGGFYPFWSPDNRSIGFFADGKVQRIDIEGGLVRTLAIAPNPLGASWNQDGTILFAPNYTGPIFRTSANGGEVAALTRIEANQSSHRFPQFLPDGRHFLYYVAGSPEVSGVYASDFTGTTKRLIDADAPAAYTPFQYLLIVRQGTLFGQAFDPVKLELSGNPFPIAEQIAAGGDTNAAGLSTSAAGPFIYRAGLATVQRQFIWFDRSGKEIGKVGELDSAGPSFPSLSPDGRRMGLTRTLNGNTDVWMFDFGRNLFTRFTFDIAADSVPIWSPDGNRIVFNSNRQGIYDLYEKPVTGSGSDHLLLETRQNKAPLDWSPDGRFVLYRSPALATGFDLWVLPMDGTGNPVPVVQTQFEERDGQFSPDGKWIAYQSNESGRSEIVVQPFPGPGDKLQVSTNGGGQVRWRPDGKELFYIALDGQLMAVPIRITSNGHSVEAGAPVSLFATRVGGAIHLPNKQQYFVSLDGQRFLMNTLAEGDKPSPITVILNWKPKP